MVKELRAETGAGVMECKRALEQANGDFARAKDLLREQGLARAAKKADRATSQGLVDAYIHAGGRVGVLVEVNCETDFVARTEEFRQLVHDIAMQIAAMNPPRIGHEPDGDGAGSDELPLLKQPFIRDPSITIEDLVKTFIARSGENVVIRRFARFELGAD